MTPIKYTGEITGTYNNKWANATTSDGSMWVWIPRFAYKISSGYHTNTAGTIDIIFVDASNKALNGETATINSHMAKNSEWGAVAYLGQSTYGTKGQQIERNTNDGYITGGNRTPATIYGTNGNQSTTYNATGVYGMGGGAYEYVASYVNNGQDNLKISGL